MIKNFLFSCINKMNIDGAQDFTSLDYIIAEGSKVDMGEGGERVGM